MEELKETPLGLDNLSLNAQDDECDEADTDETPPTQTFNEENLELGKDIVEKLQEQPNQLIIKKGDGKSYEIFLASATENIYNLANLYLQLKNFIEEPKNEKEKPIYTP